MKNIKIISLFQILLLIQLKNCIAVKNIKTAQNRKNMVIPPDNSSNMSYNSSTTNKTTYIQIPSTHPCYTNCMNSLNSQGKQANPNKNSLDQYPDDTYHPTGFTGTIYNGLNNTIEGAAALIGNTMRAGGQINMKVLKSASELEQTQMALDQQNRMKNMDFNTQLNEKEVEAQNSIYKAENNSPVYQNVPYTNDPYQNAQYGGASSYLKKTKKQII